MVKTLTIRLEEEVIEAIDKAVEKRQAETNFIGVRLTRSDILRAIILAHLQGEK